MFIENLTGKTNKNSMENKKTTELLDLLQKLVDKKGNLLDGWNETYEELKSREPFITILNNETMSNSDTLEGRLDYLEEEFKKLKRHKHDDKTGDVMIRV